MFDDASQSPLHFLSWYWEPLIWFLIIFPGVFFLNYKDTLKKFGKENAKLETLSQIGQFAASLAVGVAGVAGLFWLAQHSTH